MSHLSHIDSAAQCFRPIQRDDADNTSLYSAGRNSVESDENDSPGQMAFTIFNINWWMVKVSCPEFTPAGMTKDTDEAQIPPDIFQKLK